MDKKNGRKGGGIRISMKSGDPQEKIILTNHQIMIKKTPDNYIRYQVTG